jgi:hypothetical protein
MTHICHLPGLVLIEKDWQVLVVVGQQGMRKRLKRKKMVEMKMMGLRLMMMRRMKKFLMLRGSTPLPTYTWELQFFGYPSTRREKISYKGKTNLVRKRGKKIQGLLKKNLELTIYFTQHFNRNSESVIITKTTSMAISQWIDWTYMEAKYDAIFDEVVAACRAKHLRDVMAFQKNWNNEIITQFYATLYVEERGDTRKFHWMTEGRRYEITFE